MTRVRLTFAGSRAAPGFNTNASCILHMYTYMLQTVDLLYSIMYRPVCVIMRAARDACAARAGRRVQSMRAVCVACARATAAPCTRIDRHARSSAYARPAPAPRQGTSYRPVRYRGMDAEAEWLAAAAAWDELERQLDSNGRTQATDGSQHSIVPRDNTVSGYARHTGGDAWSAAVGKPQLAPPVNTAAQQNRLSVQPSQPCPGCSNCCFARSAGGICMGGGTSQSKRQRVDTTGSTSARIAGPVASDPSGALSMRSPACNSLAVDTVLQFLFFSRYGLSLQVVAVSNTSHRGRRRTAWCRISPTYRSTCVNVPASSNLCRRARLAVDKIVCCR